MLFYIRDIISRCEDSIMKCGSIIRLNAGKYEELDQRLAEFISNQKGAINSMDEIRKDICEGKYDL